MDDTRYKTSPLDNTNIIEWTEIILQKNYGDCSYELTSLLLKSFNSVQKSKGGKTYEEGANMGSYIKRRIQEELKKNHRNSLILNRKNLS